MSSGTPRNRVAGANAAAAGGSSASKLRFSHTTSAPSVSGETDALSWQGVAREWLLGWWRIILVQEADLYFWIALLLLTGHVKALCLVILISQVGSVVVRFAMHVVAFSKRPIAEPPP